MDIRSFSFNTICLAMGLATTSQAAKPGSACPPTRTGHALLGAVDRATHIVPLQFFKIEKTSEGPLIWKFKANANIKPETNGMPRPVSFFTKPTEADPVELKLNDRFVLLSVRKELDLAATMKAWFTKPEKVASEDCFIKSNIYLEDFIKRGSKVEPSRDNACRILVKNLEANPLINDALAFRCISPELEKRRIGQLAAAYAKAKRYGNAVVVMELVNGNFNANTLSTVLDWANEWTEKDDRSTRRIIERTLSDDLQKHFVETRQMSAMKDILEDKKRFKNLRETDWFPDLAKDWAGVGAAR
ncbi:MAG: hypothetical protein RIQ81_2216 [Pseudomonadota bacterium]|jgi:hypothetical protein